MARFKEHGTLEIEVEGQMLRIEGKGPWNLESLQQSGRVAAPKVEPLLGKRWVVLAVLHGQAVYVPEATEALVDIVKEDKRNGRVASALVVSDCDSPHFSELHISAIYTRANEDFAFFEDEESAKAWLLEKLNP